MRSYGVIEAACKGKESYTSRALAEAVTKRRSKRGQNIHAYHCLYCGGWHIGTRQRSITTRRPTPDPTLSSD